jgi:SAM-dependent methyltransferase
VQPAPEANNQYGTQGWFEGEYARVSEDPWGLSWRPSQLLRYRKLLSMLDALREPLPQVMDIGCATGDFTYLLSTHLRGVEGVSGIDFVDDAVERARRRFPALTFSKESLFTLGDDYAKRFDLITCLEVLYYVPKNRRAEALRSMRNALRPGRYALFSSFISRPPYFRPEQFIELVSGEFEILRSDLLYLRPVSSLERLCGKVAKVMPFRIGPRVSGQRTFSAVSAVESWSRHLQSLAASHTLVLARVRPCPQ